MTTKIGDLPHKRFVNGKWKWDSFAGLTQDCLESLGELTAHTHDNIHRMPCNVCGKHPSVVANKPGSRFVWCLECF